MAQTQSARDAAPTIMHAVPGKSGTETRGSRGRTGPVRHDGLSRTSPSLVDALDRLIARIETGTATPEDVDLLPDGVVEYLHAVITLSEMGALDPGWEVTPTGGILARGACR